MPISKTPTHSPFPAFEIEQEGTPQRYMPIPTPAGLRQTVLLGIPFRPTLPPLLPDRLFCGPPVINLA